MVEIESDQSKFRDYFTFLKHLPCSEDLSCSKRLQFCSRGGDKYFVDFIRQFEAVSLRKISKNTHNKLL